MPVLDFTTLVPSLTTAVTAVLVGIAAIAAVKVMIPIAQKGWSVIMGFISR